MCQRVECEARCKVLVIPKPTGEEIAPRSICILCRPEVYKQLRSPGMIPAIRRGDNVDIRFIQRSGKRVVIVIEPRISHARIGGHIVVVFDALHRRFDARVIRSQPRVDHVPQTSIRHGAGASQFSIFRLVRGRRARVNFLFWNHVIETAVTDQRSVIAFGSQVLATRKKAIEC